MVVVGPDVREPAVGDLVLAHTAPLRGHSGFWAQQVLLSAAHVAPVPAGLGPCDAAGPPVAGLTACQVLQWLGLEPGGRLLLTNAAGVTGSLAPQLAVRAGVSVTATASAASTARLRRLGAETALDHHDETWWRRATTASTRHSSPLPAPPPRPPSWGGTGGTTTWVLRVTG